MFQLIFWAVLTAIVVYFWVIFYADGHDVVHSHPEGEPCNSFCMKHAEFQALQKQADSLVKSRGISYDEALTLLTGEPSVSPDSVKK